MRAEAFCTIVYGAELPGLDIPTDHSHNDSATWRERSVLAVFDFPLSRDTQ
jgi:hypothetical protein